MPSRIWGDGGDLRTIAPSTRMTRTLLAMTAAVTCLGALIIVAAAADVILEPTAGGGLAAGAIVLAFGGLFFIGVWLWSANVRLLIRQGAVGYRDIFGRSRFWSRGEIGRIVDMAISYGRSLQPHRGFYFFGLNGRQLFVLSPRAWQANDLRDFIDATGVQVDYREALIPAKSIRREFPNGFGWDTEHVMMATLITMIAAVLLVIVGYMLISALFHA
jgi:hypothetical protein